MSFIYVTANGATVGIDGGHIEVRYTDGRIDKFPKYVVEGISIFGKSQLTATCIQFCMENGIQVSFFTQAGRYYGKLSSARLSDIDRLRKQMKVTENEEFSLEIAKKIMCAKINNQYVVVKRYMKGQSEKKKTLLFPMRNARRKVPFAKTLQQVMGYEGISARTYFSMLSDIVNENFRFNGRNRRPPNDPFNAMLSFGYSLLTKEVFGEIENRGLNAYVGFIHSERDRIPALACDLVEEWRAIIVDSAVMSLIQGNEVKTDMFMTDKTQCQMDSKMIKILLAKIEKKMHTRMHYLPYIQKEVTFREAIWFQISRLAKAIETGNPDIYFPIYIR